MQHNKKPNNLIVGVLCALICETIYGLSYVFTKRAVENASGLSLLGWRFLLAFIVINICAVSGIIKINFNGKIIRPLLLIAIFNPVIHFIGETVGISNTTASESGVFVACIPVVSLVASTLILKKRPSRLQIVGILITLAGVLLTVLAVGVSSSFSVTGYAFLSIAVVSYALYSVFVEKTSDYTSAEITYIMLLMGAVMFVTLAFAEAAFEGDIRKLLTLPFRDSAFLAAVLYQGIGCSVLAFFLCNVAIAKIGVNRTSSFIGVATIVSIVAGVIILKEQFTSSQVIGAIVIIVGIYTANAKSISESEPQP